MNLHFTKMHGLGNDFVVIDATRTRFAPDAALLQRLTDRRFGVGCDPGRVIDPAPSAEADFGYRIYNSDGSESGQCANGVRCVARYIREHGLSAQERLRVWTRTTRMEVQLLDDGRVRVDMGAPQFEPQQIPLAAAERARSYTLTRANGATLQFGAASMGNPHAVVEVASVDSAPVAEIGEELQDHATFPERVN